MKLKDYEIPQYGLDAGPAEDLAQYNLKNFDLSQLSQPNLPFPSPELPPPQETFTPAPAPVQLAPAPVQLAPAPVQPAPDPVPTALYQPAMDPGEVHFGAHFNLQTVAFTPLSPTEQWKIPRWVLTTVGVFFASAAVMAVVVCVVLLRDPNAAPPAELAVPTAAVAAAPVATAQPAPTPPPRAVPRVASLPQPSPAAAALPPHRIVVSRYTSPVRRQTYRPRVAKSESSTVARHDSESASRPPQDALDQLLNESSM